MIKDKKPLTIPEVVDLVGTSEKSEKMKKFAKEFNNMKLERALELKESLKKLNVLKLNEMSIVSLVNFMPSDAQDVMKVLEGISLDQEEISKILGVLKD